MNQESARQRNGGKDASSGSFCLDLKLMPLIDVEVENVGASVNCATPFPTARFFILNL